MLSEWATEAARGERRDADRRPRDGGRRTRTRRREEGGDVPAGRRSDGVGGRSRLHPDRGVEQAGGGVRESSRAGQTRGGRRTPAEPFLGGAGRQATERGRGGCEGGRVPPFTRRRAGRRRGGGGGSDELACTQSREERLDRVRARVGPLADQQVSAIGDDPERSPQPPRVPGPVLERDEPVTRAPEDERRTAQAVEGGSRVVVDEGAAGVPDVGVQRRAHEEAFDGPRRKGRRVRDLPVAEDRVTEPAHTGDQPAVGRDESSRTGENEQRDPRLPRAAFG